MCGGGGGGGGQTQVINQVEYTDLLGNKQVVNESEYGKTMGINPLRAGTDLQRIMANPEEAKKYAAMGKSNDLIYPGGKKPDPKVNRFFVGTNVTAPEGPLSADRRDALATGEGTLGRSGQVSQQMTDETTFGGEVGQGEEGFGRRALIASEGQLETTLPPTYTPEQSDVPTTAPNPDLQTDPNVPPVTPSESVAPDVNYIVPTAERQEQVISFTPNDPNAAYVARGPISSNLTSRRTGFGSGIII
tara:strand:- start:9758 stop:10495 length:738 start_codon:yes stop_codon:yes gene_type:complete